MESIEFLIQRENWGSPEPRETWAHRRDEPAHCEPFRAAWGWKKYQTESFLTSSKQTAKSPGKPHDKNVFNLIITHTLLDIIRGLHLFTVLEEEHYTNASGWCEELSLELMLSFFLVKSFQLQQYKITMSQNWDIH